MAISGFESFANLGMDDDLVLFQQWHDERMASLYSEEITPEQRQFADIGENKSFKKMRSNPSCSWNFGSFTSQDPVLAERKRRQKLSQRFAALSVLLPGLKKTDKASILEEAIKYMKQLQEKEKTLQEMKITSKTAGIRNEGVIEARCCNSEVLISIHCDRRRRRRKGILAKIVAEIEKLHLSVAKCSVMPFGDSALNITIISQMEEGHKYNGMSMEEVVKILHDVVNV